MPASSYCKASRLTRLAYNMKFPGNVRRLCSDYDDLSDKQSSGIHIGLLLINVATIVVIFFHWPATVRLAGRCRRRDKRYGGFLR